MEFIELLCFLILIIPSSIIHEYCHGWTADRLGDPTARYAGRLTLDPRVHIDKWGTLLLPLFLAFVTFGKFIFAYAKPVPYNPYNLKSQKWGPAWVALAGPISNLIVAFIFSVLLWYFPLTSLAKYNLTAAVISSDISIFSVAQGDPSAVFFGLISIIVFVNILLAIFNLVPIPPLDGSKLLFALLPGSQYRLRAMLEQYGMVILLAFIFFGFRLISPIILN